MGIGITGCANDRVELVPYRLQHHLHIPSSRHILVWEDELDTSESLLRLGISWIPSFIIPTSLLIVSG